MKEFFLFRWRKNNGSVLFLTLWAMALLSVFAVYMGYAARAKLDEVDRLNKYSMLRHISKAGVSMARQKLLAVCYIPDSEAAQGIREVLGYSSGGQIETKVGDGKALVAIKDEERYLNINTVPREALIRLIQEVCSNAGGDAEALADGIIDWRDADSSPGPKGAEDEYYASLEHPYNCKDAPFNETDELLLVRGFSSKIYEDLAPFVTVCGEGLVNINTTCPAVLRAIGLDNKLVDKVMQYRASKDGVLLTDDDEFFSIIIDEKTGQVVVDYYEPDFVFTPEEIAALAQKAKEGLLGTIAHNFFVESTAVRASQPWRFVTYALFTRVQKGDLVGAYDMKLEYWRTSP